MRLNELLLHKSRKVRVNFTGDLGKIGKKVRDNAWKLESECFLRENLEEKYGKWIEEVKGSEKFENVE